MFDKIKPRNFTCVFVLRKVARTMDYKEEIKKLIDTIESEKLLEFIYKFIKDASVRWK